MISSYNLKAVVFDDKEDEAKPLIDALNYDRIPNIFINFKDDDREDQKQLQNVRIVFADLIVGEYASGDDAAVIEAIRASILDNISVDNGPFILVAWSKHSSLVSLLKDRVLEIEPKLNFLTVELDKNKYFEKNVEDIWVQKDANQFSIIGEDIVEQLSELEYIEIFLEWEKDARNSISKILNNFLDNISDKTKVKNSISATIKKTIGKQEELTSEQKLEAFYRTLNETLSDSIENNVAPINKHDNFLSSLYLEDLDEDLKAEINSKTLFEDILDGDRTLKNGNIYSFEDFKAKFSDQVIEEICGYQGYHFFYDSIFQYSRRTKFLEKIDGESNEAFQDRHKAIIKEYVTPILMEFTPSCDIANPKNFEKSRLIFGLLINSKYKCLKPKSESFYLTTFHFKVNNSMYSLDNNYRLAFFTRNIFAVNPEKVKEMTPIIKARKEFVTDLQHAIANHISRIGISSVDSQWN